jgi:hypothetical protein
MKSDESVFIDAATIGQEYYVENIKLLLYKENPDVFERIDFDDDHIYQEPLLFAYFNFPGKSNLTLENILYGYMKPELRPIQMDITSDEFGRIYLAKVGWINTHRANHVFRIETNSEFEIQLYDDETLVKFEMEALHYISENGPEIVKHPVPLFQQCYIGSDGELVNVEVSAISAAKTKDLVEAWRLMKELIPIQYELIRKFTKKMIIFKLTSGETNSFATKNAQGVAFFNAYQEDYNEVFFIDDIAHQTGHVIFSAVTAEPELFLKLDPNTLLQEFSSEINQGQRTVYVLFHALYTYYAIMKFLDQGLVKGVFSGRNNHEAQGRMFFYISKSESDIELLEELIGTDKLFTNKGFELYAKLREDISEISQFWKSKVDYLNIENQPYNFTYALFVESNPFERITN